MVDVLQWVALVICGGVTLARLPDAVRGHNRSIFGAFLFATMAILLSIDGPYLAADRWLGGENYANLILRFLVYGAVLLAGYRTAKAFDDTNGVRRITGPAGLAVLAAIVLVTAVTFVLADTAGSSTGLTGLPLRSAANARLIEVYAAAGRVYPGFVALCLVPATARAVGGRFPVAVRSGALLLTVGYAGLVAAALFPFVPGRSARAQVMINYTAILGLSVGLTVIWLAGVAARRRQSRAAERGTPAPSTAGTQQAGQEN